MALSRSLTSPELKVMNVIWDEGGQATAARIYEVLSKEGFERAFVYSLIHKCIGKSAVERVEPGFLCRALVERGEVQLKETKKLVDSLFGGSAEKLLISLVDPSSVSPDEIERLRSIVKKAYGSNV